MKKSLIEETNHIVLEASNDKKRNNAIKGLNDKINDLTAPLIHLQKYVKFEIGELERKYSKEISKLVANMVKMRDELDLTSEKALFQEGVKVDDEFSLLMALNEDLVVQTVFLGLMEAEDDKKKPSLQPPKEWIEKMKKRIAKASPHYSVDRILKTIGDIWYHNLDNAKRSEIRGRYGKVYGKSPA